jgi:hypothetical protein
MFVMTAQAVVFDYSTKNGVRYLRSGNKNTGDRHTTYPIINDGKATCSKVGNVTVSPDEYGNCPMVMVYHLVNVTRGERGLLCSYDYIVGGGYMFTLLDQRECPDVIASYEGMAFFKGVYLDSVDTFKMYNHTMTTSFDGDFTGYPKVERQIRYRED